MEKVAELRKSFAVSVSRQAFRATPTIEDDGLLLGHGTVLARMGCTRRGEEKLMLEADEARLLALLSAVCGRQINPRVMHQVSRASDCWSRGDEVLANIELAYARFPRLQTEEDAFRLFLAENLLAQGMSPRDLAIALGFDPRLLKYDPNEPRQPAGSGRPSGRWIRGGDDEAEDSSSTLRSAEAAVAALATSLVESPSLAATAWMTAAASVSLGVIAFAGAMVIPTPNSGGVYEGDVPTVRGLRYKFSKPSGELQITATADDGETVTLSAHRRDNSGVYYDAHGRPLGRDIGTGLYVNLDSVDVGLRDALDAPPKDDPNEEPSGALSPLVRPDEPRLCPDPSSDQPKGKRKPDDDFNERYQEYIGSVVNPQIIPPLPAELAYGLFNPQSGKLVMFDHCQLTTGIMIEAKGHYESVLGFALGEESVKEDFIEQANRQIQAANANDRRPIEWHFYEQETMEFARKALDAEGFLKRIRLVYTPYPGDEEWSYPKRAQRTWAKGRQKQ